MSFCILFILLTGGSYVTPGCYVEGVYITPQDVVVVSHIPTPYNRGAWLAPQDYVAYYSPYSRFVQWHTYIYVEDSYRHYRRWPHHHRTRQYRRHHRQRWGFWRHNRRAPHRVKPHRRHHRKYKNHKPIKHKRSTPKRRHQRRGKRLKKR